MQLKLRCFKSDLVAVKINFSLLITYIRTSRRICVSPSRSYFTHLVVPRTYFIVIIHIRNIYLGNVKKFEDSVAIEKLEKSQLKGSMRLVPPRA